MDKADAPPIQESYPLAVAYTALLDAVKSITTAVEDLPLPPANAHCETVAPGTYLHIYVHCVSLYACVHSHTVHIQTCMNIIMCLCKGVLFLILL